MAENQIPVVLARFSGLTANDKRGIQKKCSAASQIFNIFNYGKGKKTPTIWTRIKGKFHINFTIMNQSKLRVQKVILNSRIDSRHKIKSATYIN